MGDSANGGCGAREQTLLEAAKATLGTLEWSNHRAVDNLRAAIAREEAKPSTGAQVDYQAGPAAWWQIRANEANDRAQKAEAEAKWHRKESARLSAELAKAKESAAHLEKLRVEANELATYWARNYSERTGQWKERAEKAEAELAKLRAHVAKSLSMPPESSTDDLIDTDLVVLTSVINDLARTGMPLPLKVRDAMPQVVDELLLLRAELTKVKAQRDDYAEAMQKVMDDDMKAALAGAGMSPEPVQVGIVRDPVTGWTFDTMRQQFDAARTTVRVLAAELVAARQQIAGTKGFEA